MELQKSKMILDTWIKNLTEHARKAAKKKQKGKKFKKDEELVNKL